jgi:hypothetical protein
MVAGRVVYFPSIRVPSSGWFSRILLYWDEVATIAPAAALQDRAVLGLHTSELIDHGLLHTVAPDFSVGVARNYFSAFLALVDQRPGLMSKQPLSQRSSTRVHVDKTGFGLAMALEERGLADYLNGPEFDGWFEVEAQTADLLMAFLALIIARSGTAPMVPITDQPKALAAFRNVRMDLSQNHESVIVDTDAVRTCMLRAVLPAPSAIRAAELAEFKAQHRGQLVQMRSRVENEILKAAVIADPEYRARQLDLSVEALREETQEIAARMTENRWTSVSPATVVGVVGAGVAVADAVLTGGLLTMSGASVGLAAALWGAFEGTRPKTDWLDRPMAYAAVAQEKFGSVA